ncbi:TauD/TfdA family dioxygenase [Alphaproteobacteria bacterium]|jgi:taurine dioxygenase|nr:TauD/TfdA family dioxygenase [Alphaproteobacteria bacterium]|tara:strand:- start:593 stop:1537 length:945 start_codon:yes stop_codon:yes gene_type:complete
MSADNFSIVPTGAATGAEVKGVDLTKPLSKQKQEMLRQAWADHQVLLFRNQILNDDHLTSIANIFGGVRGTESRDMFLKGGYKAGGKHVPSRANFSFISNLDEEGNPTERNAGLGSTEVDWHTDQSYTRIPNAGTLLYSMKIPDNGGGDTSFSNQYLAYETLPIDLKEACQGKYQRHDISRNSVGQVKPSQRLPKSLKEVEGPDHPLLRVHPVTDKTALYLGRRRASPGNYIIGMNQSESDAFLGRLWGHATKDEFKWTHRWRVADLLVWDNRCVMHHRSALDPSKPRVMNRTMVKGEPITAPWDDTDDAERWP